MSDLSTEAHRLLQALCDAPSPIERLRGDDPRRRALARLATLGELRVVPQLLRFFAADDPLSEEAARTIGTLLANIGPAELDWLDGQARSYSCVYGGSSDAWWTLSPSHVSRLARVAAEYPAALGMVASHPDGHVREAAVKALGTQTSGQEIPFLALRANDWVWPVAARAGDLLARRLVADHRPAVLAALPFLVRMLARRRQDHTRFAEALRAVLVTNDAADLLARIETLDTRARRLVYELTGSSVTGADAMLRRALADNDAPIRRSAVRRLAALMDTESSTPILEDLSVRDRAPGVRKEALSLLAERRPDRARHLLPRVLLGRAARVRELARFLVQTLDAPIVARNVYVEGLAPTTATRRTAAIAGVGETGTNADVDLIIGFFSAGQPRVRRTTLRALARLDVERAIPLALTALADAAPSVRSTAVDILAKNSRRVDFAIVRRSLRDLEDPATRRKLLQLVKEAPKWDAAVLLLETLADRDEAVHNAAAHLLDGWVATFNRHQVPPGPAHVSRIRELLDAHGSQLRPDTASLLRFSLKVAGE